jgi:hypothetical protein
LPIIPAVIGTPDFGWFIDPDVSEFGYTVEPVSAGDTTIPFLDNGTTCGTGSLNTIDRCWLPFSTDIFAISNHPIATTSIGEDIVVKLRAQSGPSHHQEEGAYQATIVFTAVTN